MNCSPLGYCMRCFRWVSWSSSLFICRYKNNKSYINYINIFEVFFSRTIREVLSLWACCTVKYFHVNNHQSLVVEVNLIFIELKLLPRHISWKQYLVVQEYSSFLHQKLWFFLLILLFLLIENLTLFLIKFLNFIYLLSCLQSICEAIYFFIWLFSWWNNICKLLTLSYYLIEIIEPF